MIRGSKNKGDWSEFYALLYLLGTKKLYAADEDLEKLEELFFPILNIMRNEKQIDNSMRRIDFVVKDDNLIEVYVDSVLSETRDSGEFADEAAALGPDISNATGAQFVIPHGEFFFEFFAYADIGSTFTRCYRYLHEIT